MGHKGIDEGIQETKIATNSRDNICRLLLKRMILSLPIM